jgi:hypothetical protein
MNRHPRTGTGWVEAITGSMFSGKSEELIRRVRRAQIARQPVQIFKPRLDDRYGADHIVSHSDMKMPSQVVASAREILERVEEATEVVGIDEAQFFDPALVDVVNTLADRTIAGDPSSPCRRSSPWPNTWTRPSPSACSAGLRPIGASASSRQPIGWWWGGRTSTRLGAAAASIPRPHVPIRNVRRRSTRRSGWRRRPQHAPAE